MDDLREHFITESRDLVQRAADDLLALERTPGDPARIDSAFRALHTLKGSAGLFDFAPLTATLHAAEDLMGAVRDGATEPATAIATLLECIGTVEHWIETIAATGALPADAAAVAGHLASAMQSGPGPAAPPQHAAPQARPDWLAALLARAPQAAAAGETLTALRYTPDADCFFRGDDPLAIIRAIADLRLVHVAPRTPWSLDNFDPFRCNLVIEILAASPRERIDQAIRFVRDQVALATVEPEAAAAPGSPVARTLRIDARHVDALADIAGELIVAKNRLAHLAAEAQPFSPELARTLAANQATIARLAADMHRGVTRLRSVPLGQTFRRLPRIVRETAARLGKQVHLHIDGADTEADKDVADALYEPLLHLLRNAVDHGIETPAARAAAAKPETGRISLQARREGDQIIVEATDDGAGIDPARVRHAARLRGLLPVDMLDDTATLDLIFTPGFSTAAAITDISGRGVGLDAVRRAIEAFGGRVTIASTLGQGATFRIAVPLAAAVTTIIVVRVGSERFGVPMHIVVETRHLPRDHILPVQDGTAFVLRDRTLPLVTLASLLGRQAGPPAARVKLMVIVAADQRIGVAVDGFGERIDVVLRPLGGLLAGLPGALGTAMLGDGSVLLVLDVPSLAA